MSYAMFLWLCILSAGTFSTLSAGTPRTVGGVTRPNYGVDFNFLFQVNNMHGSWKHAWVVDLSILDREMPTIPNVPCNLVESELYCKSFERYLREGTEILWNTTRVFQNYHSWMHDPRMLETLSRGIDVSRKKRALLPFIGDIEKFFFGVATESDVAAIRAALDDFTSLGKITEDQIAKLGNNLASLTLLENDQVANTEKGFERIKMTFSNLTDQVDKKFSALVREVNGNSRRMEEAELAMADTWIVLTELLRIHSSISSLVAADLELLSGIQQILMGYIPIGLIPPHELQTGLEVALAGIRTTFPQASLSYGTRQLGYYYTHQIVTPILQRNRVTIIVDIPIDLHQQILNVYSVRPFPVPLEESPRKQQSNELVALSMLVAQPHYFLVEQDGEYYSTAEDMDILTCKGSTVRYCSKQFPLYHISVKSCLQQLWMDQKFQNILSYCPYEMFRHVTAAHAQDFVQVTSLSNGRWSIQAPLDDKWIVTCPSSPPEVRDPCTSCIIQVNCGCGIRSKYFTIPTRVVACLGVPEPISVNETINPFSYLPKYQPWVMNLTGSEVKLGTRLAIPDIELPLEHNWDDVIDSMERKRYDLNRLYQKQNNESVTYRTEAEALLQRIQVSDKILESLSQWPDWLISAGLCLSFLNTAVICLLCFCFLNRGVHALPTRYEKEVLRITGEVEQELGLLESLEGVILFFTILNTILLFIILGPTIHNWIMSHRWVRKVQGLLPQVKANHYRKKRHGVNIILEGTGTFALGSQLSTMRFQILAARVPKGTWVDTQGCERMVIVVGADDRDFNFLISSSMTIIFPNEEPRPVKEFSVNRARCANALNISPLQCLITFEDVKIRYEV